MKIPCVLGIDTSNYTTSLAMVDRDGNVLEDRRKGLPVSNGQRGLRQSDAVFHHVAQLPELMEALRERWGTYQLAAVAASTKPRPQLHSYMPCFRVGESFARVLANALLVPFYGFSHQEGHISAVWMNSNFQSKPFLAIHMSGGTTEILRVDGELALLGGTKDISYGQVLDRVGVKMGMAFPCGRMLDELAMGEKEGIGKLSPVSLKEGSLNLSGLETQAMRILEEIQNKENPSQREHMYGRLIYEIFQRFEESLVAWIQYWVKITGIHNLLLAGGVSSSKYIRQGLNRAFSGTDILLEFGDESLSSDNAIGIAYLGRSKEWPENPSPFHN
ncbi:MAG: O-sialoglycoprotein endopeptidase [Anaerovoracaceae bacterium]|jgi:N6-L-threonylcarbamoyladenine synthase